MIPDTEEYNSEIRRVFYVDDKGNTFVHTEFLTQLVADAILRADTHTNAVISVASLMFSIRHMAERARSLDLADSIAKDAEKIISDTTLPPQNESLF